MERFKKNSLLAVLMLVLLVAEASMVSAEFTSFLVKDDGQYFQYNQDELNNSYLAYQISPDLEQAGMYIWFIEQQGTVVALGDSEKGWIDYPATATASLVNQIAGKAFSINEYFASEESVLYAENVIDPNVVNSDGSVTPGAYLSDYYDAVNAANNLSQEDYTSDSWEALQTALIDNTVTATNTQQEIEAAAEAINEAIDDLVMITKVERVEALNGISALVTFTAPVENATAANFIVLDENENKLLISNIEISDDNKKVTLNFSTGLEDEMTYKVVTSEVTDEKGEKVESNDIFTYIYADPATIVFTSTSVDSAKENISEYIKVTDILGRDITNEVIQDVVFETSNVSIVGKDGSIGLDGSVLVVAKLPVNDTYLRTAQTILTLFHGEATTFAGYHIYDAADGCAADTNAFNALSEDKIVTTINLQDDTKYVALYYYDQNGNSMDALTSGFEVINLYPGTVIVENDGKVIPITAGNGSAQIKIDDIQQKITVKVKAASEVADMVLAQTSVSISSEVTAPLNKKNIAIAYADQYGDDLDVANLPVSGELKAVSGNESVAEVSVNNNGQISITGIEVGTAVITLKYSDDNIEITRTLAVTVYETGVLTGYVVENESAELNLNKDNDEGMPSESRVQVFGVDSSGNKIVGLSGGIDENAAGRFWLKPVNAAGQLNNNIVDIASDNETVYPLGIGTGYVEVYVGTLYIETLVFNVENTLPEIDTIEFNAVTIVNSEFDGVTPIDVDSLLYTDIDNGIIAFLDLSGEEINASGYVEFVYHITNIDGMTVSPTTPAGAQITEVADGGGIADIVISEIHVDSGANLLTAPQVVRIFCY
jgi:hypothetical protein